jgi:protocatechuate 3,4-dioxygenase beta subunit
VLVTVERDGFATEFRDVATSGEETRVEIDLEREASVTGQVRDSRGRPLPGAIVCARESASRHMRWEMLAAVSGVGFDVRPNFHFELAGSFVCDESGRYSIRRLAAGRRYTLEATKWDEALLPATLEVVPPTSNADFVLAPSSRLDVEVELKATPKRPYGGRPYVYLEARDASGSWKQASIADAVDATHFRFGRVAPGLVRVGVASPGLALTRSEPFTIAASESAHVRVEVGLGRAVSGRIVDPTGAPLAHMVVILYAGNATARFTVTRADGRFEIEDLPLGAAEIAVGLQRIAVPAGVSSIPDVVHAPSDDDPDEPR